MSIIAVNPLWRGAAATSAITTAKSFGTHTSVSGGADATTAVLPGGGFILLDMAVTPELAAEGLARDVVRAVQLARRRAGLGVPDRISLTIASTPAAREAMRTHQTLIATQTLATGGDLVGPTDLDSDPAAGEPAVAGEKEPIRIRIGA
jgi:isoleucyl-tRNA synthetase